MQKLQERILLLFRSHWSWYWNICISALIQFEDNVLRNIEISAYNICYAYIYTCVTFHSPWTLRSWAWKSPSITSNVMVTCPTWRRTRPGDSSWTDGLSIENIYRNPRDSHSFYFVYLHNHSKVLCFVCLSLNVSDR